jgi:L-lactate dehydrogenase complex protein LldF
MLMSEHGLTANQFIRNAHIALEDVQLKTALDRTTLNANTSRINAMAELPQYAEMRQQARGARLRALHDLPEMLEQVEANVIRSGGKVLWALDGEEARNQVLNICREHKLKRGVKGKSMVTEEIELVPFLAKHSIHMVETDLGEYIVQISHDRPSHIVMPLMHMTKERVRDEMMRHADMPYVETAEEMTLFARQKLRRNYLEADFGMSGGNFIIAETGHVVTVSNEGNIRLSTTVPRVHIAMVGIEKVIPTWEDFMTLVQMLPRAGTGQKLTVYVNAFLGPARENDGDGPQDYYLILLDNGRSNMYVSEAYAEAMACIRCGACLNICPVFQNVGGHAYGSVYPGPIGSIVTPLLMGKENASLLPFASSLCGACKEACPVDINIPDMLLKLRHDLEDVQEPVWKVGMRGFRFGMSHPLLYQAGGKLAGQAAAGQEKIDSLPYPLSGWTDKRDLPPIASQRFRDWWVQNREK